jgi:hypothetical protein
LEVEKGQGRQQLVVISLQTMEKARLEELALKVICVFIRERKFNI